MNLIKTAIATATLMAMSAPAMAQMDHSAHGGATATAIDLPAICLENADHVAGMDPMDMSGMPEMSAGHQGMMAGMDTMHRDMMVGMMADDFDVAFVCGMIPHHRGAIEMANAALEHAEDPWVRELAEEIVAAQEREIAEMLAWLEAR